MTTTTPREPGCRRGDVALVLFPDSNLRTAKLRPVLVVQADDLQTYLPQVIVAMITSKTFRAGHVSRVEVLRATAEGRQSGLLTDSVVMTDNLATINDSEIHRVVGSLPMNKVEAALRHTLAL
jgi:mRNA interferase MazF